VNPSDKTQFRAGLADGPSLLVYLFINGIFVFKYASRLTSLSWLVTLLYIAGAAAGFVLLAGSDRVRSPLAKLHRHYWMVSLGLALGLWIVMLQFDPEQIRVSRRTALEDWIRLLLEGRYPYLAEVSPSGFPFLFVLTMPFYFLGDVGLLQIVAFGVFAFLVSLRDPKDSPHRFCRLLLLVGSPIFLYEVVVRSDLFSNMVFLLFYWVMVERRRLKAAAAERFLWAALGGLLLSTRAVALLVDAVVLPHLFRAARLKGVLFALVMGIVFLATLAPFILWDADLFAQVGPFSIQGMYIPGWMAVLALIAALVCGLTGRSLNGLYRAAGLLLFAVVFAAFVRAAMQQGLSRSITGDGFDLGYFIFALPFLLISLDFSGRRGARAAAPSQGLSDSGE